VCKVVSNIIVFFIVCFVLFAVLLTCVNTRLACIILVLSGAFFVVNKQLTGPVVA